MKKLLLIFLPIFVLSACSRSGHFTVEGTVTNAKGSTLYFERNALEGVSLLDSVVLTEKGSFRFKAETPDVPEFYRLRMGRRSISLGIEAGDCITIQTDSADFNAGYSVEGSPACARMHEIGQLHRGLTAAYRSVSQRYEGMKDTQAIRLAVDTLMEYVRAFKEKVSPMIFQDPKSPAAYYALYLQVASYPIFTPFDKEDSRLFSSVATAWQTFYPESPRTGSIVKYTLGGIQAIRNERNAATLSDDVEIHEIDKLHFFDIRLPDIFGEDTPLSSLEGKVILLDFTAYQSEGSAERVLLLRELHHAYSMYGFEIYQVSLDGDEHFWKTGAFNLPWVCVRDRNGLNSPYLRMYNVSSLPTYFLIGKDGSIVARDEQVTDLEAMVVKLLKETDSKNLF